MGMAMRAAKEADETSKPLSGALAALSLSILLASLGTSIANVALPQLAEAFDAPFPAVQWVVLAYLLAVTTTIVGAGRLGDLIGRRRLLLAGIGLFTSASIACALAPSLPLLIAARAAQGIGAAIMMALSMAMVGDLVLPARTGRAMGLLGAMSAAGTALGPSLGGALLAGFAWPAIFLALGPLGGAALALAAIRLPDAAKPPFPAKFDTAGILLLALALAAYSLAMTIGRGGFGAPNFALLAASATILLAFLRVETRSPSPLVDLSAFHDPRFSAGLALNLLVSTVLMTTLVVGPFYLGGALGLSAAAVGAAMSVGPLVVALGGVPAGRAVDRFGAPLMTILGLSATAAGCLLLAMLPEHFALTGYLPTMALLTLGYAAFQTANNAALLTGADPSRRGTLSGLLNLSRSLGLVTGASLMGTLFAHAAGTTRFADAAPEAVAGAMRFTFAVAALLMLGSILISATIARLRPQIPAERPQPV